MTTKLSQGMHASSRVSNFLINMRWQFAQAVQKGNGAQSNACMNLLLPMYACICHSARYVQELAKNLPEYHLPPFLSVCAREAFFRYLGEVVIVREHLVFTHNNQRPWILEFGSLLMTSKGLKVHKATYTPWIQE
jgi:hypothetical protein